eukprot:TRINITY_DN13379_c0_g1_i1.p1 TRINITY_DN13379_c0_g1~~TRINITY_DN13379_c0_g1_i1.p1  ORF type:complete len:583 (+),score=89.62 TRINITY_DN13379_c0_g1_i1:144-1892(+)
MVPSPDICCASTADGPAVHSSEFSFREVKDTDSMKRGLLAILEQVESSKCAVLNAMKVLDAQCSDGAANALLRESSRSSPLGDDQGIPSEGQKCASAQVLQAAGDTENPDGAIETRVSVPRSPEQASNRSRSESNLSPPSQRSDSGKKPAQKSGFKLHVSHKALQRRPKATTILGAVRSIGGKHGGAWFYANEVCMRLVSSRWFDLVIGAVILTNSVGIGIETQWSLTSGMEEMWPVQLDLVFVSIYLAEIAIRFVAFGWVNLKNPWFVLDFSIVIIGAVAYLVTTIAHMVMAESDQQDWMWVMVIRVFRLLRLLRALRMLRTFRMVWRLVHGILNSYKILFSTAALLILVIYVFAILGLEFIAKNTDLQKDADTNEIIQEHFSSLQTTMLTYLRFVNLDTVHPIYEPIVRKRPMLVFYFGSLILMVSIGLMNVVTAVLVEAALDSANDDMDLFAKDMASKLAASLPTLETIFTEMDTNGDGTVSAAEIERVPLDVIPAHFFQNHRAIASMHDIFLLLDVDNGGSLSHDEFLEGLVSIFLHDAPIETLQIYRLVKSSFQVVKQMDERLKYMEQAMEQAFKPA